MAIDSAHPLYSTYLTDWKLCRDSYRGERIVKESGQTYLPATPGQHADGMTTANAPGSQSYKSYKERAVFPDFVAIAVETFIGLMWSKPPTIELPAQLEAMRDKATTRCESLEQLLRRINEQQLVVGRAGMLLDLAATPTIEHPLPYIAVYNAEHIINWDDGNREQVLKDSLNLVVLDESEYERNADFEWEYKKKHRVLVLGETLENEATADYKVGLFDEDLSSYSEESLTTPSIRGQALQKIPFTFVNSKDTVSSPDDPPLLGLARLCMTIYRGEADYRQSLFLQGQDTLVVIGSNDDDVHRVGAGAAINLPAGGEAKFIGVSSDGLGEQRQALENDRQLAANKAGELIDSRSKEKESGEALNKRIAAKTATLNQIALSGAEALQSILRTAAEWVGANPEEVVVTPNLDFANMEMAGRELIDLMTARSLGAPLSKESIHKLMQDKNLTEMSFEDEQRIVEEEGPDIDDDEDTGLEDDIENDPEDN